MSDRIDSPDELTARFDDGGSLGLDAVPHPAGPVVLHASGEIDVVTAPFLVEQLGGWFAVAPTVILDLSGISFLGSPGLAALLAARRDAGEAGVAFHLLCGDSSPARRILQVTGTMEHLDVLDRVLPGGAGPDGRPPIFPVPG